MSIYLENAWTPATEQTWSEAYTVVTQLMLSGADYPVEILTPAIEQDAKLLGETHLIS
ncbi:hypothetical protein [Nostoc sp.]|uniref:hypothetical protein n=1 Tax=Nostoc sp. TaxID=1180 RepID=UPI002FF9B88D